MKQNDLRISGYSTALFSTWFFIEDFGLLFDAGDGVASGLLQKSRKVKQVFISHADRDHLTGLFQFNQLNAREGLPIIHYPESCGSFPFIKDFTEKFDPHVKGTVWVPIQANQEFKIKDRIVVKSIRNNHVIAAENLTKSLSYMVVSKKSKLKEAFKNLSGNEIKQLSQEKGKAYITETVEQNILGYSGDTPVEDYERWNNVDVLIHEATFLNNEVGLNNHANKHSNLEDVMRMVSEIKIGKLILSHFSSRYSKEEIDEAIIQQCKALKIDIPVYRVLPGEKSFDILKGEPVNR